QAPRARRFDDGRGSRARARGASRRADSRCDVGRRSWILGRDPAAFASVPKRRAGHPARRGATARTRTLEASSLVDIDDAADAEMNRAARRYDRDRVGLGDRFFDAVEKASLEIVRAPFTGQMLGPENVRRMLVQRFPFQLVYEIAGKRIRIIAV